MGHKVAPRLIDNLINLLIEILTNLINPLAHGFMPAHSHSGQSRSPDRRTDPNCSIISFLSHKQTPAPENEFLATKKHM
jgi:hypothetical protein